MGDTYDDARIGTLREGSSSLEAELLHRRRSRSQAEARMAAFDHIEASYDPVRRHPTLGHRSPVEFEKCRTRTALITSTDRNPEPSTQTEET